MYEIVYSEGVADDLRRLTANHKTHEDPPISGWAAWLPPWDHVDPVWELRVGEYRVFYDVDQLRAIVSVRAIRHKPPRKTTGEIL